MLAQSLSPHSLERIVTLRTRNDSCTSCNSGTCDLMSIVKRSFDVHHHEPIEVTIDSDSSVAQHRHHQLSLLPNHNMAVNQQHHMLHGIGFKKPTSSTLRSDFRQHSPAQQLLFNIGSMDCFALLDGAQKSSSDTALIVCLSNDTQRYPCTLRRPRGQWHGLFLRIFALGKLSTL